MPDFFFTVWHSINAVFFSFLLTRIKNKFMIFKGSS